MSQLPLHRREASHVTESASPGRTAEPLDIRHLMIERTEPHPTEANGVHRVACKIALEQDAIGHRVSLISLRDESLPVTDQIDGLASRSVALTSRDVLGHRVWLANASLEALTAGSSPNTVFHIHSAREMLLLSLSMALKKMSLPYVITIHGRYSHIEQNTRSISSSIKEFYLSAVESRVLEGAAFIHALSVQERDIIHALAPKARVEVIPNAAYSTRTDLPFRFPVRSRPRGDGPRFGYLGRYAIKHKGLDILIEAFRLYRDRGGRGRLELFGTGSTADLLALLARHGVDDTVSVAGGRFGQDKLLAFADWDYFVQLSRFEGSPIGIMEAALAGLPVIVTPGTGLGAEVAHFDAGFSVGRPTPQDVCEALLRADQVSPTQWSRMSDQSHAMAKSFGDWTAVAKRLSEHYVDQHIA